MAAGHQLSAAASPRSPPSFLGLPAEIRLAIYEYLLVDPAHQVVSIRSEDHESYARRKRLASTKRLRSSYWVKAGPYRTMSAETSYVLQNGVEIHPAILGVSRQIHAEAAYLLYGSYVFDFSIDVESAVPFFEDRTPIGREAIRRIHLEKRAWPYIRNFDKYEWSTVCAYIAERLRLQYLGLGVFGGKVDENYYMVTKTFEKSDFCEISKFDGMEWVEELVAIKGLQNLDIKTIWEVCPLPCSNGLAFFADFSASIEKGFAEYLRENMLVSAA